MISEHYGEWAALATAFCWAITALSFEYAGKRVGSLAVNLIRLVMALVFLAFFTYFTRGQAFPTDAGGHAWFWLSLSGLIGFVVGDLSLFRAFVVAGARLSMLIMSLVPPLTAIIGWLVMGERLVGSDWLGMSLTVFGVGWVVLERQPSLDGQAVRIPKSGILLAFIGAIGQAVGLVLSKYGMGNYSPFAATQIRVIAGIVGFSVLFVVIGWWPKVFTALKHKSAMSRITLGSVFGPFLGVSLSLAAVKYTTTGVAATIMSITPVLIIPVTILLYKQRVSARASAGAVLAVTGVAILFLT